MPETVFQKQKMLRDVCTLGVGGPADAYVEVKTVPEMQSVLSYCRKNHVRTFVLGKGSNTLFDDRGFKGVVIHNKIDFMEEKRPGIFRAGAGHSFSLLGVQTARKGWSGLEFASGIPGTVGGAVFMNAGANGRETCESLESVDFVSDDGELQNFPRDQLQFSYRHSSFHNRKGAIVAATFALTPSLEARKKQLEIIAYRTRTQPYGEKSAGCFFRNPEGMSAGALIDRCGLKGLRVGGAEVSSKHANFLINTNNGTSQDVKALVGMIRQGVKEKTGIELECEVRYISWD